MKSVKLSVIIPNFNRKNDILNTLESIYNQNYNNFEVIVVDDCSTDDSVLMIKKNYSNTKVIDLKKNQGPCVARNTGIKASKGKIIVGFDSDVVLIGNDNFQKIIDKFADNQNIGCQAFRILKLYNKKDDINRWWHSLPVDRFNTREFYTDYFSGTAYAFKKEVFDKAGYFPEEIFMHNEEMEMSLKTLDAGYDIIYNPEIEVYHNIPKNESRIKHLGPREFYYKRRNQIWMITKYYPFLKGIIFISPRLIITFFQAIKEKMLKHYFQGLYEAIKCIPRQLKMRQPLKKKTWVKINLIRKGKYIPKVS